MKTELFKNKITNNQPIIILAAFVTGIFMGIWIIHEKEELCFDKYNFVNHHVACSHDPVISKIGYAETQGDIEGYINQQIEQGNISEAAVYFRDLENGPVWGINETADFAPASLLKLPLVLVYLTLAERNPELLNQKITPQSLSTEINPAFPQTKTLEVGKEYSIEDLLKQTIIHSDNQAYFILVRNLVDSGMEDSMIDILLEQGIVAPQNIYDEVVSVRRYAGIFRALYNSSFVSSKLSEKALGWLAQSNFPEGLRKQIPQDVPVAHKFGERFSPDGGKQLHDCGIIYYPANPYLLCVMTRGDDWQKMLGVISEISRKIYEEVDSRKVSMIN